MGPKTCGIGVEKGRSDSRGNGPEVERRDSGHWRRLIRVQWKVNLYRYRWGFVMRDGRVEPDKRFHLPPSKGFVFSLVPRRG